MKKIFGYIRDYLSSVDKGVLLATTLLTAVLVAVNYSTGLTDAIEGLALMKQWLAWSLIFAVAFGGSYAILLFFTSKNVFEDKAFLCLLVIACCLFAWKMCGRFFFVFTKDEIQNAYWNKIAYWPFKLLLVTEALWLVWKWDRQGQSFYASKPKGFDAKPYWLMLLIMLPLILLAATQPDFQKVYPKIQHVAFIKEHPRSWLYFLLYELSYGSDFFTIELFFRGFLILAFVRFAGKDAILPMAAFYCAIHFGKPLGECISSYFGGTILGVVVYHTRSIWGGFMVHVGIAWMMELAGLLYK